MHAYLLAKHRVGNVYVEALKRDLDRFGRCDRALEYLLKAVELEPSNSQAAVQLSVGLALGVCSIQATGQSVPPEYVRHARSTAHRAMRLDPESSGPCSALGMICDCECASGKRA